MTLEANEQAPPALLDHCRKTYAAMLSDEATRKEGDIVIYEGFLTHLITGKLSLSVPYYTAVRKQLIRMGCIRQLRRGGGTSPSQYELVYEPTEEAFFRVSARKEPKKQHQDRLEGMEERLQNLTQRLSELEGMLDSVVEAIAQHFGTEKS